VSLFLLNHLAGGGLDWSETTIALLGAAASPILTYVVPNKPGRADRRLLP
jgi:hypothetical protein